MKVLCWTERAWPQIGGVEIISMKLMRELRRRGHEFLVVTDWDDPNLPQEESHNGVPIVRFPFRQALFKKDLRLIREISGRLAEIVGRFCPALVHLHSVEPSLFFVPLARFQRTVPTLLTAHGIPRYPRGEDGLLVRTLRRVDWVTACSNAVLSSLLRSLPDLIKRSSVIPYGLGQAPLDPLPLSLNPPCLLCVGRLVPQKGFDLAIEALEQILKRFPTARLTVAGDGPARSELEAQVNQSGVRTSVEFLGRVDPNEVPSRINEATLVIVPSRTAEGLPIVALQAAQMARPVVASRLPGLSEAVDDGRTGILVKEENSREIAEAVIRLLENPRLMDLMGQAGRQRINDDFSLKRFGDDYDLLYRKLLDDARRETS